MLVRGPQPRSSTIRVQSEPHRTRDRHIVRQRLSACSRPIARPRTILRKWWDEQPHGFVMHAAAGAQGEAETCSQPFKSERKRDRYPPLSPLFFNKCNSGATIRWCTLLLTSKKWPLQRGGRQSRRRSIEMKSNWLFDEPQSNSRPRLAASNNASQSTCLAGVRQSHCNPHWDFLRFLGSLLGPEEGRERVLGQMCDFSWDRRMYSDYLRSWCAVPVRRAAWGDCGRNSRDF